MCDKVQISSLEGPPRVDPRLAPFLPADLDVEQRALYDAIAAGPRAQAPQRFRLVDDQGGLEGPFNAFLLQPTLGEPLQQLGAAIRFCTRLSDRARELAILVVAHHWRSDFEWYAHEAVGRSVGVTERELRALQQEDDSVFASPERTVVVTTQRLCAASTLTDDEYAEAVSQLGAAGIFELTTLVGYYATLALQLRVFRVGTPR